MAKNALFQDLGGEPGCLRLARDFYARVAEDPNLRSLFPGKSLRCATEELSAFLVQFFDGEEAHMQYRWWLSLRESHARFRISESQRSAWLGHMNATLDSFIADPGSRADLSSFFEVASTYIVSSSEAELANPELDRRWRRQQSLDRLIDSIVAGRDAEAIALAEQHLARRSVTVGILARMMETEREPLIGFVLRSLERDKDLAHAHFNGRFLLHFAAGSGCLPVLLALLAKGVDANVLDQGGHAPLYRAANGCGAEAGPEIIRELVRAGASVDHGGGVTRSTALHAAARRGHLAIAKALIDSGASMEARDSKGFSPLDRAKNCRKLEVAMTLESCMAAELRNSREGPKRTHGPTDVQDQCLPE